MDADHPAQGGLIPRLSTDWPLWAFVVVAVVLLAIILPALFTVREEEIDPNLDDGIWGSIWALLIGFCGMSYLIFAAFTGRHEFPSWLGFVGLIGWSVLGYAFLLKLIRRFRK